MPQDRTPARTRAKADSEETKQVVRRVRRVTRRKFSPQEKAAVIALVRGSPPESEHGHFVDEARGVAVHVEARFRKEYDAERLVAVFPGWLGASSPLWTRTSWRPA